MTLKWFDKSSLVFSWFSSWYIICNMSRCKFPFSALKARFNEHYLQFWDSLSKIRIGLIKFLWSDSLNPINYSIATNFRIYVYIPNQPDLWAHDTCKYNTALRDPIYMYAEWIEQAFALSCSYNIHGDKVILDWISCSSILTVLRFFHFPFTLRPWKLLARFFYDLSVYFNLKLYLLTDTNSVSAIRSNYWETAHTHTSQLWACTGHRYRFCSPKCGWIPVYKGSGKMRTIKYYATKWSYYIGKSKTQRATRTHIAHLTIHSGIFVYECKICMAIFGLIGCWFSVCQFPLQLQCNLIHESSLSLSAGIWWNFLFHLIRLTFLCEMFNVNSYIDFDHILWHHFH